MRNAVYVQQPTNWRGVAIKLLALAVLVAVTNFGFYDRMKLLYLHDRWFTMVFYVGIWATSIGALLIASFQPNKTARLLWGFLLSFSAAAGFMYTQISGTDLSVFDALSLWVAKHEAGRASEFYQMPLILSAVVFLCSFFIISAPPVPQHRWIKFGLKWLGWTPAVPVLLISAIVLIKEGGGSQAMPAQFQPLAVGLVTAEKVARQNIPPRAAVTMQANGHRPVKNIIMLIDESVRADYIFWEKGNPVTPILAAHKEKIVDFGQAVSGGNCSSYSNAILRFGPNPKDIIRTSQSSPTIFQYAKKAGFYTVFIDGQSGINKDPGLLQNFMTPNETKYIDKLVRFENVKAPQLDYQLLANMVRALKSDKPVFIYANKNGAHFPYDEAYPAKQTIFGPTVTSAGQKTAEFRINSYFNVLAWSVDKFFGRLFKDVDLSKTAIIYTSDHGQALIDGKLTHCSVKNANPREGLVPMMAITGIPSLKQRFKTAAEAHRNTTSHFQIRPTVLELMGYNPTQIKKKYGASLFEKNSFPTRFTSGDIFGVFRADVRWNDIDLTRDWREFSKPPQPLPGPVAIKSNPPRPQ